MRKIIWFSFMLIMSSLKKCQQCSIEICFSWKVSLNSLTLICKVSSLEHYVYIKNQFNQQVADCHLNFCDSYHQNASIKQILKSNETIFTVNGQIDNKLNGNWTCQHGLKLDIAQVEVTVLKDMPTKLDGQVIDDQKEHRNKSKTAKTADRNCTESLICYTLVGFVAMIAVCSASNWILERYCNDTPEICRNKFCSSVKEKTDFEALPKSALIGMFLLFLLLLFGIPVLVSVVQKGTCFILAIPSMVVLGLTLGGTTSIVCFGRKINSVTEERGSDDQNAVIQDRPVAQITQTDNHAKNNSCDNDEQGCDDVVERDSLLNQTSQAGDEIWVNCLSNVTPYGQIAEFLVNGITFKTLRKKPTGCYSTISNNNCSRNTCRCLADGKEFSIKIKEPLPNTILNITCSMKFKLNTTFFAYDRISIHVLDVSGPVIDSDISFPIMAGTNVNLRCSVESNLKIDLQFACLNISIRETKLTNDTVMQVSIPLKAKAHLDKETCTCIVQYKKYKTTTSISLNISSPPALEVLGRTVYNSSSIIHLSCYMFGDLDTYGFDPWSHTVNDVFIRHLKGENNGNMSILVIRQSSFRDSGEYSCNAWNTKGQNQYWSNKTTVVVVNAAPVIIGTYTYNDVLPTFSVIYFAKPSPNVPQWFKYTKLLMNSSRYSMRNIKKNISFGIYGKITQETVYSANLSMEDEIPGTYTVLLSNEYGQLRTTFNWKPEKPGQLFLFGLLVLTGMIVFILTAGVIAVVTKIKSTIGDSSFKQYRPGFRRAIYYAAPEDENTPHVYHRTDPEYEEPSPGHYMEISDIYVGRNSSTTDDNQYEIAHDYIELE
ncbi:unnamed protein product [Mytilus coruscus]|uniref:Ig-like domain-containing protein n=1 Tax=Mytilus coruscus TaxID=42192 RepID=A0A6J8DIJ8_MYTCO|nr:unnamed protein product [Mytilus coruscus]